MYIHQAPLTPQSDYYAWSLTGDTPQPDYQTQSHGPLLGIPLSLIII